MEIKLLAPKPEYAELFFEWRNQAASKCHNPLLPLNVEECRHSLLLEGSNLHDLWNKPSFRWFLEVDGRLFGNVSLKNINKMMLTAEIAYGVGEAFQGKGLATASVAILVEKIFQETDLRKLIAMVHDQNFPSRKLLSRLGFKEEGLLREHYLINGKPENEIIFGLLKYEWSGHPSLPHISK